MSDREMARAALKRGYDDCEARNVCNCGKSDCSAYLDAIATALAQARAEGLRQAAEVCGAFDGPARDSDFCNGQATAAQQIRARLRALAEGGE